MSPETDAWEYPEPVQPTETPALCATPNENAKYTRELANLVRRARWNYDQFRTACKTVRLRLGLKSPKRTRRLPKLLTESELQRFYRTIDKAENLQHQIMLRLLFYTAIRVAEFTRIRTTDVDLGASKIFVELGKGSKDRYILFPEKFRLLLRAYMESCPDNEYLFESAQRRHYSVRRIQQLVKHYAEEAEIEANVHPHLFRHQMLTWLTKQGLPDSQIQLISGHSSKKSLEVYQHLSLDTVEEGYQKAAREIDI